MGIALPVMAVALSRAAGMFQFNGHAGHELVHTTDGIHGVPRDPHEE